MLRYEHPDGGMDGPAHPGARGARGRRAAGAQEAPDAPATVRHGDTDTVRKVVLASGKVAHEAIARRNQLLEDGGGTGTVAPQAIAVLRVEQLYPWPEVAIESVLQRYPGTDEV